MLIDRKRINKLKETKEVTGADLTKFREFATADGKKMSMMKLANLLGYKSDATVHRWEDGKEIPARAQITIRDLFRRYRYKF